MPQAVCSQDSAITLSADITGGTFTGPGVSGNIFTPSDAGFGPVTITYVVTVPDSACPGFATSTIQVNPAPVVALSGLSTTYCTNSSDVTLVGIPALGTFSGTGVTGNVFSPSTAGVGTHVLRYEFNNGTCTGYDEVTVTVTDNLTVTFEGMPTTTCSEADPFVIASNPAGAVFTGPGIFGNTFSPKVAGVGTHTITATLTNGACSGTATQQIVVTPSPEASFIMNQTGSTVSFANGSVNAATYSWNFGDNTTSTDANPSHTFTENGNYTVTLIASSPGCGSDTATMTLGINVGIGSIDGVDMIQLYPNPTNGAVNLVFNSLNQQSFEVRITDAAGRLIQLDAITNYVGKFNKQYDLSEKAKGVYFFTVTSEKGAINFRVVRD
jgi:hypothetical protein